MKRMLFITLMLFFGVFSMAIAVKDMSDLSYSLLMMVCAFNQILLAISEIRKP